MIPKSVNPTYQISPLKSKLYRLSATPNKLPQNSVNRMHSPFTPKIKITHNMYWKTTKFQNNCTVGNRNTQAKSVLAHNFFNQSEKNPGLNIGKEKSFWIENEESIQRSQLQQKYNEKNEKSVGIIGLQQKETIKGIVHTNKFSVKIVDTPNKTNKQRTHSVDLSPAKSNHLNVSKIEFNGPLLKSNGLTTEEPTINYKPFRQKNSFVGFKLTNPSHNLMKKSRVSKETDSICVGSKNYENKQHSLEIPRKSSTSCSFRRHGTSKKQPLSTTNRIKYPPHLNLTASNNDDDDVRIPLVQQISIEMVGDKKQLIIGNKTIPSRAYIGLKSTRKRMKEQSKIKEPITEQVIRTE